MVVRITSNWTRQMGFTPLALKYHQKGEEVGLARLKLLPCLQRRRRQEDGEEHGVSHPKACSARPRVVRLADRELKHGASKKTLGPRTGNTLRTQRQIGLADPAISIVMTHDYGDGRVCQTDLALHDCHLHRAEQAPQCIRGTDDHQPNPYHFTIQPVRTKSLLCASTSRQVGRPRAETRSKQEDTWPQNRKHAHDSAPDRFGRPCHFHRHDS